MKRGERGKKEKYNQKKKNFFFFCSSMKWTKTYTFFFLCLQSLFAEMMLPDGVQKRSSDWTLFFLNRKSQIEGMVARSPFNLRLFQFSHPKKMKNCRRTRRTKGQRERRQRSTRQLDNSRLNPSRLISSNSRWRSPREKGNQKVGLLSFRTPCILSSKTFWKKENGFHSRLENSAK